jgi:adenosine kinase
MDGDDIRKGLAGADALMVNEYEYSMIQNKTGLRDEDIRGDMRFMVVTYGEKGTKIYAEGEEYSIPIVPPNTIVDPTGVGDAFRGGFLTGFSRGFPWEVCGRMGALAATYCLEVKGTQVHTFTRDEFIRRYREYFDDSGILEDLNAEEQLT